MNELSDTIILSKYSRLLSEFFNKKQIFIRSAASSGARVTTVVTMLATTAIATRIMTKEEFGLWAILVSFIYLSWILDFGFRYSMGNRLTALVAISGGKSTTEQRELYLSIFYFQCVIGIILSLIYLLTAPYLNWSDILKIAQLELVTSIIKLMNVVFISLFLNIPFMLMGTGFFCLQVRKSG